MTTDSGSRREGRDPGVNRRGRGGDQAATRVQVRVLPSFPDLTYPSAGCRGDDMGVRTAPDLPRSDSPGVADPRNEGGPTGVAEDLPAARNPVVPVHPDAVGRHRV